MQALLLGLAALVLGLGALHAFSRASPQAIARMLRLALGAGALAGALAMLVRGSHSLALPLAGVGFWLLSGQGLSGSLGGSGSGGSAATRTSRIETEHLEMELDLDDGSMRGKVRKGFFQGRRIESLKPVELAHLWQDCRFVDPDSAQLVEAYLDRVHPTWREDLARAEAETQKGDDGRMTRDEALDLLGVGPDADEDTIRRAHRELILKVHPDRGGSTYLAAKVNEAKDVALGL
jgi:hypothetical protein